mgnify:CR=1 FL=1
MKAKQYLNKLRKLPAKACLRALHKMEVRPSGNHEMCPPIIFIIGPPRSGSTLLFQALTHCYDFGYISNRMAPYCPALSYAERFRRHILNPPARTRAHFQSIHGRTADPDGPHECGEYWYQFFPRKPQYIPKERVEQCKIVDLQRSLARVCSVFPQPFLFKNMNCALRLNVLVDALPNAVFLITRRSLIDTAHSLLETRLKVNGNYQDWWSMQPEDYEHLLGLTPEHQVVRQISSIYHEIEKHQKRYPHRFLDFRYEQFCEDPCDALKKLEIQLSQNGFKLNPYKNWELPERFERRNEVRIDKDLYGRLSKLCNVKS